MALTETQLKLIEQGITLAVAAVLAAVQRASETGGDAPLDWSKLRITETPQMAREKAEQSRAREQAGAGVSIGQEPAVPNGNRSD